MKHFHGGAAALLLLGVSLLGLDACQSLAGIEDRTYDSDAGSGDGAPSAECKKYCELADQVCTGDNKLYASQENCWAVCALLPAGDLSAETGGNTVACRTNQLLVAQNVVEGEPGTLP